MAISSPCPIARSVKRRSGLSSGSRPFSMLDFLEEDVLVDEVAGKDRQAGATDGACLGTDDSLDNIGHYDALQIQLPGFTDRRGHDAFPDPAGKTAVDDGCAEVDDRGSGDDRLR